MENPPRTCGLEQVRVYASRHNIPLLEAMRDLLERDIWPRNLVRNFGLLSVAQQQRLLDLPIFIAGCGGLGGEMAAQLVMLGASHIYLCDYDSFEESNLNRQRYCDWESIGREKAVVTTHALEKRAPWGKFIPVLQRISSDNVPEELNKSAVVVDCLDSVNSKKMLQKLTKKAKKVWLYGAVLQHEGFATLESPPDDSLERLYGNSGQESGAGSVLSHVVAGTAALMTSLFIKWLSTPHFKSPMLHVDFSGSEIDRFEV